MAFNPFGLGREENAFADPLSLKDSPNIIWKSWVYSPFLSQPSKPKVKLFEGESETLDGIRGGTT
jgi:hypothetical protein